MADDTCWDFVSSQMVPLAMAGSLHSNSQLAAIADPKDVINTFISVLAHNLAEIPKNEVCICSMHNNSTPYIFSYSALSFIIFHHILAAQGHCCRHFNKVPPQSVQAVRVAKVMALLSTTGGELNVAKVEAALNASPQSRKSQQKFLRPDSTDTKICKARMGQGGNTTGQHCYIISQSAITVDDLTSIRQGI